MQSPPAVPQARTGRIEVIDSLRGFAVFGLLVSHCYFLFFLGEPLVSTRADEITSVLVFLLVADNFYTLFSFLFGLSFSLLLARGSGNGFTAWKFAWRLLVLGCIGFAHNLHWNDDILSIYAVLGLLLIPVRLLPDRIVLALAAVFLLNLPTLPVESLHSRLMDTQVEARVEQQAAAYEVAREAWKSGSYPQTIRVNIDTTRYKLDYYLHSGRFSFMLGFFLLGLVAGRRRIFQLPDGDRMVFARWLRWSGLASLLLSAVVLVLMLGGSAVSAAASRWLRTAMNAQGIAMTVTYAAGFSMLAGHSAFRWLASAFAAVGRMALTNYVLHSLVGTLLLSGYGAALLQRPWSATASTLAAIPLFALMVLFSRWWITRFAFGPLEWLWRMGTDLRFIPLRRRPRGRNESGRED